MEVFAFIGMAAVALAGILIGLYIVWLVITVNKIVHFISVDYPNHRNEYIREWQYRVLSSRVEEIDRKNDALKKEQK